eukprot:9500924-Pyramimonas_sp.AAC.6
MARGQVRANSLTTLLLIVVVAVVVGAVVVVAAVLVVLVVVGMPMLGRSERRSFGCSGLRQKRGPCSGVAAFGCSSPSLCSSPLLRST